MTTPPVFYTPLSERTVISLEGADRFTLLQGLLTNSTAAILPHQSIYSCMLTPQGKYLFDFFLSSWQDQIWIDVAKERLPAFLSKLTLYKLRAQVAWQDRSSEYGIFAISPHEAPLVLGDTIPFAEGIRLTDPRFLGLPSRVILPLATAEKTLTSLGYTHAPEYYATRRMECCIPEGDKDLLPDKSFPLEFGLDQLHAIDFQKGCYVGQEVTARTKYRGVVRKRPYRATAASPLPPAGTDILAGTQKIGTLCSSHGMSAIALLRYEEAEAAFASGTTATAEGIPLTFTRPVWYEI